MSIVTLNRKSRILHSRPSVSGKPTIDNGNIWVMRGPFRQDNKIRIADGNRGFSLNGSRRLSYIGKTSAISDVRTPFKGTIPVNKNGKSVPIFNVTDSYVEIKGNQYKYTKPSVLTNQGMLRGKIFSAL